MDHQDKSSYRWASNAIDSQHDDSWLGNRGKVDLKSRSDGGRERNVPFQKRVNKKRRKRTQKKTPEKMEKENPLK